MKRNLEFFFVDSSGLTECMPDFCKMGLLVSLRRVDSGGLAACSGTTMATPIHRPLARLKGRAW